MMNYTCAFSQSEIEKCIEWIILNMWFLQTATLFQTWPAFLKRHFKLVELAKDSKNASIFFMYMYLPKGSVFLHEHVSLENILFYLVGRTLDATEGKTGSLRQTAEEVITTFCSFLQLFLHTYSALENSALNFNVEITQQGCKEGLLRRGLFRSF